MNPKTDGKRAILHRLGNRVVRSSPLPQIDETKLTRFDDPVAKFREMLEIVGGQSHCIEQAKEAQEILDSLPEFRDAKQIASLVPDVLQGNVDASSVDDPHTLESLDWVVARGEFMVAENGAIWVDGATLPHRVLLFIPQYLAIVVPRSQVVHHMHEAYARIGRPEPGFGVFVSGPSKTADIEQSLVLGAHGCRTLQVFLTA
jgi:L-lactate dehydrogenase complex protein LldG